MPTGLLLAVPWRSYGVRDGTWGFVHLPLERPPALELDSLYLSIIFYTIFRVFLRAPETCLSGFRGVGSSVQQACLKAGAASGPPRIHFSLNREMSKLSSGEPS